MPTLAREIPTPEPVTRLPNGITQYNIIHWLKNTIYVDGSPMEIEDREYMHGLYSDDFTRMVLYTGRQIGKSLYLATVHVEKLIMSAPFRSIYVAPRQQQCRDWCNDKFRHIVDGSPPLRPFRPTNSRDQSWRVFDKEFLNGSSFKGRASYLSADGVRGITGDMLTIDEVQDMQVDNIPVLMETLSYKKKDEEGHIAKKYMIFSGTPKTTSHALYHYWQMSDKREWLVRCVGPAHCNKWNLLGYDNIGKYGLVCSSCGKDIYAENGRWIVTDPGKSWVGFRIPQIMTPWTPIYDPDGGQDILSKMNDYPVARFFNEVLAITYDEGEKPITAAELWACCKDYPNISHPTEETVRRHIFAGLDWGGGTTEFPSYTVLTMGYWLTTDVFRIFFLKKFDGLDANIMTQPEKIIAFLRLFNVRMICCDWGYGHYQNAMIMDAVGKQRVMELQYAQCKDLIKYNPEAKRMIGDRTMMMQQLFWDIQKQKIEFFRKSEFERYGQDILNIFIDYNEKRQLIKYDHAPTQPDDCAHAINYTLLAAKYHDRKLIRR